MIHNNVFYKLTFNFNVVYPLMILGILHTRDTSLTITISHRTQSSFVSCKLCKNLMSHTISQIDAEYGIDSIFIVMKLYNITSCFLSNHTITQQEDILADHTITQQEDILLLAVHFPDHLSDHQN